MVDKTVLPNPNPETLNAADIIESNALRMEASARTVDLERLEKRTKISEDFAKIRSKLAERQFKIEQNYQKQIDATDDENTKRHLARQKEREIQQIKFDEIRTEASERYLATEQKIGNFIDDITDPAKFLKRKAKEATIATIAWLLSKRRRKLDHEENLKNAKEIEQTKALTIAKPTDTSMVLSSGPDKKSEERLRKMFKGFMPPTNYYENMLFAVNSTRKHQENMTDITNNLLDVSEDSLKTDKKRNKFQRMMAILQLPKILAIAAATAGTLKIFEGFKSMGLDDTEAGVATLGTAGAVTYGAKKGLEKLGTKTASVGKSAAGRGLEKLGTKTASVGKSAAGRGLEKLGTKTILKSVGRLGLRAVPYVGTAMIAGDALSMAAEYLGDKGGWDAARETKNLGAAEINAFGTSEITDWKIVEDLPIAKIQGLIRYDDWDDSTMSRFQNIIAKKEGKVENLDPAELSSTGKANQLEQAALTTNPVNKETGTPTSQNSVVNAPVTNVTNQTIQDKSFNNDITVQQLNPWAIKEQYA